MSASVTVGFVPATTPLIATGVTGPAGGEAEGSEANLFAALLALLTPPSADGEAGSPTGIPAPLTPPEGQPATPLLDISGLPAAAAAATSAEGKSLLKDLGAALIAINEALEAGKPVHPALEKKLAEQLDAVAAYLSGLQQPAAPIVAPAIADTGGIDLAAPVAAAPTAPPASADLPGTADLPDALAEAASAFAPITAAADGTASETPSAPAAPVTPPAAVEARPVPPMLAELGKLIKHLGAELERQLPDLAKQLGALGDKLASGDVADDILEQLGISRTGKAASPDLKQIVAALGAPAAAPKPAAPQQPFTIPALQLPDAVAPVADDDAAEPVAPAVAAPAGDGADTPDVASPTPVHVARPAEAKPADADPKLVAQAATPAANAGMTDSTAAATAPDPGAAGTQVAATAAATGTRAIHAAYLAPVQQLNVPQVAFEVVRHFEAGNTRFQIRLDPPELGRIDVKLDMDKNGTINARMVVERPETLDLMQRDHRALQQALQQAGLDSNKTNLEFSLRQNPFARDGMGGDGRGQQQPSFVADGLGSGDGAEAASVSTLYRGTATAGGVNLFV